MKAMSRYRGWNPAAAAQYGTSSLKKRRASGDVCTVVQAHRGGMAFEVRFVSLVGETVAIVALERVQIRSDEPREIALARRVGSGPCGAPSGAGAARADAWLRGTK